MKSLKIICFIIILVILFACKKEDEILFSDYASIKKDLDTVFIINDQVPDFEDYLIIHDRKSIKNYEIITNFDEHTHFNEVGEYTIEYILHLENDKSVNYKLQITVEELFSNNYNFRSNLYILLANTNNAEYLRYETTNDVSYTNNKTYLFQSNASYEYFYKRYSGDNLLHFHQEYNFNGESDYFESYYKFENNKFNIYTNSYDTNYEWVHDELSIEEYLSEISQYGNKTIENLLDGISEVYPNYQDNTSKTFEIPLSKKNFSLNIALDMLDAIAYYDLYDIEPYILLAALSNHYHLIHLTIKTDATLSKIIEINYDYTQILNQLLQDQQITIQPFNHAIYKEFNFNTDKFELSIPIEVLDNVIE